MSFTRMFKIVHKTFNGPFSTFLTRRGKSGAFRIVTEKFLHDNGMTETVIIDRCITLGRDKAEAAKRYVEECNRVHAIAEANLEACAQFPDRGICKLPSCDLCPEGVQSCPSFAPGQGLIGNGLII